MSTGVIHFFAPTVHRNSTTLLAPSRSAGSCGPPVGLGAACRREGLAFRFPPGSRASLHAMVAPARPCPPPAGRKSPRRDGASPALRIEPSRFRFRDGWTSWTWLPAVPGVENRLLLTQKI